MGALHEGHAGLMRVAREQVGDGPVVVSIFVNPLQFGPARTSTATRAPSTPTSRSASARASTSCSRPSVEEVYPGWPAQPQVTVEPGPLAAILEGRTRPGHFRGVLTVVAKLFGLVRPDVAVFGEKDYQQLVLIRRMVADLCLRSRSSAPRPCASPTAWRCRAATATSTPSSAARRWPSAGRCAPRRTAPATASTPPSTRPAPSCAPTHGVDLDYLVDHRPRPGRAARATYQPGTEARILVAARVGTTRLIDNLALTIGGTQD